MKAGPKAPAPGVDPAPTVMVPAPDCATWTLYV